MARAAVRLAESALGDLEAIKQWYAEQGASRAGDRIIRVLLARIETLRDHPDIGRIVPEFELPFLRELIQPPFRIVYRRDPDLVRVVRVWRSARPLAVSKDEAGPLGPP